MAARKSVSVLSLRRPLSASPRTAWRRARSSRKAHQPGRMCRHRRWSSFSQSGARLAKVSTLAGYGYAVLSSPHWLAAGVRIRRRYLAVLRMPRLAVRLPASLLQSLDRSRKYMPPTFSPTPTATTSGNSTPSPSPSASTANSPMNTSRWRPFNMIEETTRHAGHLDDRQGTDRQPDQARAALTSRR